MLRTRLVAATLAVAAAGPALASTVADRLRARLETTAVEPSALSVGDEALYAPAVVARFYQQRIYRPAWSAADGSLAAARDLVAAIEGAGRHGLEPFDYHLETLRALLLRAAAARLGDAPPQDAAGGVRDGRSVAGRVPRRGEEVLTDLELAATDAFVVYGSHLLAGRVDAARLEPTWAAEPDDADMARVLEEAIAGGGIATALEALLPRTQRYGRLAEGLVRYRELAARGGWPALGPGPKLERGSSGPRVRQLRRRLALEGFSSAEPESPEQLDAGLEASVRAFQSRHGLETDGVVGPKTLEALDLPAAERAAQIARDLERWRWLPRDLGRRHLVVNVPAFELRAVEDDRVVMAMRAVVGRPYRSTPIFSATMSYLVVSPYWHVPPGIAVRDVLPAVQRDPSYLAERGFRVFQGWGAEEREIDPAEVDWKRLTARGFPYRFRQEPSDKNSLGRLKFMFPNEHNVYLHDTPLRELFAPASRAFSSGCIRIERPFDLADWVLRGDPRWTHEAVVAAAAVDAETTIQLPERIPVHILYWTSWADDGEVQFRDDVYGRDPALAAALAAPPPRTRGARGDR